jgi:hypothetical protein
MSRSMYEIGFNRKNKVRGKKAKEKEKKKSANVKFEPTK